MTADELLDSYPKLYHMAEHGSWPQIKKHGLLSTTALLDLYGVHGAKRASLERSHRPESVILEHHALGACVLRDQRPMPPQRLKRCLSGGISPSDWYRLLNRKVFFWTSRERLITLLHAKNYRGKRHDVLVVDTKRLLQQHAEDIELCHINSGNTFPYFHKKSPHFFKTIAEYPVNRRGRPKPPVVEVVVGYGVPKIATCILDVRSRTSRTDYGSLL